MRHDGCKEKKAFCSGFSSLMLTLKDKDGMERLLLTGLILWGFMAGPCLAAEHVVTQVSTIDALMTGVYDGGMTLDELGQKGDFGTGTFNTLNGEMILLDGQFYRATAAGTMEQPDGRTKTPFAAVTTFTADRTFSPPSGLTFQEFTKRADAILPTSNIFYAVKITGTFQMVKTRSVPPQERPYKPLTEVVKTQPVFDLKNIAGTIVGFRCPSYAKGINVPGYHLHFLAMDHKSGGHVLDFQTDQVKVDISDLTTFQLILPADKAFYSADLTPDREKELRAVEK